MHDITRDGNPVLRQIAKPLTFPLSDEYKKLADDMMEYLINSQDPKIAEKHQLRAGVGLAAPQVGESIQTTKVKSFLRKLLLILKSFLNQLEELVLLKEKAV